MKTCTVLSATGSDKVGLADDMAAALSAYGIEIEESRMATLEGQFAMVIRICGESRQLTRLRAELPTLADKMGLHLEIKRKGRRRAAAKGAPYVIESYSVGAPGIGAVTAILKRHNVNIEDLETDASQTPLSPQITFRMKARVAIPTTTSVASLRGELRSLEREKDIDIVIRPATLAAAD
jgi:glycine cleavage system regulatory protein